MKYALFGVFFLLHRSLSLSSSRTPCAVVVDDCIFAVWNWKMKSDREKRLWRNDDGKYQVIIFMSNHHHTHTHIPARTHAHTHTQSEPKWRQNVKEEKNEKKKQTKWNHLIEYTAIWMLFVCAWMIWSRATVFRCCYFSVSFFLSSLLLYLFEAVKSISPTAQMLKWAGATETSTKQRANC